MDIVYKKTVVYTNFKLMDTSSVVKKLYRNVQLDKLIGSEKAKKDFNKMNFIFSLIADNMIENEYELKNCKTKGDYYKVLYDKYYGYDTSPMVCVVCKKKVATWNDKTMKYGRICDSESCKKAYVAGRNANVEKVHGTSNLAADPEFQKTKLLPNRSIAKEYAFENGDVKTCIGNIEYSVIEKLDELDFDSKDIFVPAPFTITYYNPKDKKKSFHIPDIYIKSLDLIISVKDGMDNPNKHPNMQKDRLKSLLEYVAIVDETNHNYIQIEGMSDILNLEARIEACANSGHRFLVPPRIDLSQLIGESLLDGIDSKSMNDIQMNYNTISLYVTTDLSGVILNLHFNILGSDMNKGYCIDLVEHDIYPTEMDLYLMTNNPNTKVYKVDIELKSDIFSLLRTSLYMKEENMTQWEYLVMNMNSDYVDVSDYILILQDGEDVDMDRLQAVFHNRFKPFTRMMDLNKLIELKDETLKHSMNDKEIPIFINIRVLDDNTTGTSATLILHGYQVTLDLFNLIINISEVDDKLLDYINKTDGSNIITVGILIPEICCKFLFKLIKNLYDNNITAISPYGECMSAKFDKVIQLIQQMVTPLYSTTVTKLPVDENDFPELAANFSLFLSLLEDKIAEGNDVNSLSERYKALLDVEYNDEEDNI